ncbi:hypothetical protein HF086_014914 [Spodoptera exigua]|uniref:Uncharacterized protein n=1 Tax=Spodoptera exigua TaxID=7107 RepID=A0A922MKD3_SPOEX|nr:hypothetical protein HF086_014914 [Spodoptera exigua]
MNELLQKHGCSNVFSVPEGLKELMSDITPNYLAALLITREHGVMAVKILDELCDCRPTVSEHLLQLGLNREEASELATIIKTEIEGHEPVEGKGMSTYFSRGYHLRRNVLKHLTADKKMRKRSRMDEMPGPPLDVAHSREIDLGPVVNVKIKEDDVNKMFEDEKIQKFGMQYDPMKTITHTDDDEFLMTKKSKTKSSAFDILEMPLSKQSVTTTEVKESSLLTKLLENTDIDENMIPAVQEAIRSAFMRRQAQKSAIFESSSDSEKDSVKCAAKHTLNLYRQAASADQIKYEIMARKIQSAYRAYGVRRDCKLGIPKVTKPADKVAGLVDPNIVPPLNPHDTVYPRPTASEEAWSGNNTNWTEDPGVALSTAMNEKRLVTISSTSVAGSFLTLPALKPYSVHDDVLSSLIETPEREHGCIDYTDPNPHLSIVAEENLYYAPNKGNNTANADIFYGPSNNYLFHDTESIENILSEEDIFYRPDDMKKEDSYDGDTEIGNSDGSEAKEDRVKVTDKKVVDEAAFILPRVPLVGAARLSCSSARAGEYTLTPLPEPPSSLRSLERLLKEDRFWSPYITSTPRR